MQTKNTLKKVYFCGCRFVTGSMNFIFAFYEFIRVRGFDRGKTSSGFQWVQVANLNPRRMTTCEGALLGLDVEQGFFHLVGGLKDRKVCFEHALCAYLAYYFVREVDV